MGRCDLKRQVFCRLGCRDIGVSAFCFGDGSTANHARTAPAELLAANCRGLISGPDGV
jgi:hypothetical protein